MSSVLRSVSTTTGVRASAAREDAPVVPWPQPATATATATATVTQHSRARRVPELRTHARPRLAHAAASRPRVRRQRAREPRAEGPAVVTRRHPVIAAPEFARASRRSQPKRLLWILGGLVGLTLLALGAFGGRRRLRAVPPRFAPPTLRKMSATEPAPEERLPEPSSTAHLHRRRVALREWPSSSGACRRLRRSVGHHRPLSPSAGRRRPDGERLGRARNARHDRGRSRGSVPA